MGDTTPSETPSTDALPKMDAAADADADATVIADTPAEPPAEPPAERAEAPAADADDSSPMYLPYGRKVYSVPGENIITARYKPIYVETGDEIGKLLASKSYAQWRELGLKARSLIVVRATIGGAEKYAIYASIAVRETVNDTDDAQTLRFMPPVVRAGMLKELEALTSEKKKKVPELFGVNFEDKQLNPVEAGWTELTQVLVTDKPKPTKPVTKRKMAEIEGETSSQPEREEPVAAPDRDARTLAFSESMVVLPRSIFEEYAAAFYKR
jgi:hypothetical protein